MIGFLSLLVPASWCEVFEIPRAFQMTLDKRPCFRRFHTFPNVLGVFSMPTSYPWRREIRASCAAWIPIGMHVKKAADASFSSY